MKKFLRADLVTALRLQGEPLAGVSQPLVPAGPYTGREPEDRGSGHAGALRSVRRIPRRLAGEECAQAAGRVASDWVEKSAGKEKVSRKRRDSRLRKLGCLAGRSV